MPTLYRKLPSALLFFCALSNLLACNAQKHSASTPTASTATASTATADAHTWHLKLESRSVPLTDYSNGQTRDVKMMSMLVPDGWSMTQGANQNFVKIDCADNSGRVIINANNPEQTMGIFVIPATATMSTNNQNYLRQKEDVMHNFPNAFACQNVRQMDLAENFQQAVPKIFKDAQIVGQLQPVPGLSDQLPSIVENANRNGNSRITAEAGRIRLTGKFRGKPADMWLVALATHRTENYPGGPVTFNDLPLVAVLYAPPGELDKNDKLLMTLLSSVQIDRDWIHNDELYVAMLYQKINGAYATVNKIHQQMAEDDARAAAQQQAIRNDTANYAQHVYSTVAANRAASLDHSSQQFALYMGDQAIYKDPATGQRVQMSSSYSHVWASTTGNTNDYIMTDSPSYDPNGHAGSASWTQMQVEH
jgi:hypothetical protein